MKKMIAILMILSCCQGSQAQGTGSFFSQKKTQKKYYLEQIAALQLYTGYIRDGYKAVGKGLNIIGAWKEGEFTLHDNYYRSLSQVSTVTQHSQPVREIYRLAESIEKIFRETIASLDTASYMPEKEMNYIRKVYTNLKNKLDEDMEGLSVLLSPGKLQLTEDERSKRIREIQSEVADKYAFTLSFTRKALFVAEQRKQEMADIRRLKKMHNIKD